MLSHLDFCGFNVWTKTLILKVDEPLVGLNKLLFKSDKWLFKLTRLNRVPAAIDLDGDREAAAVDLDGDREAAAKVLDGDQEAAARDLGRDHEAAALDLDG